MMSRMWIRISSGGFQGTILEHTPFSLSRKEGGSEGMCFIQNFAIFTVAYA